MINDEPTAVEALALLAERGLADWTDEEVAELLSRLWRSEQRKFWSAADFLAGHADSPERRSIAAAWAGVIRRVLTDGADAGTGALRDARVILPDLYTRPKLADFPDPGSS
jgi:hypothetical protein